VIPIPSFRLLLCLLLCRPLWRPRPAQLIWNRRIDAFVGYGGLRPATSSGADLALRLVDPFLDLRQELVDHPGPAGPGRGTAGVSFGDQSGEGVVRAPCQVRGGMKRTDQIERSEYFREYVGDPDPFQDIRC
jgi:hypothetical protein